MDKLQPIVFRDHANENDLVEKILCDNYRAGIKYPPIAISFEDDQVDPN